MKRAILFFGFLLSSVALFAQVHGPAPSVNSFTGSKGGFSTGPAPSVNSFTGSKSGLPAGPAPSVNSVGPRGFQAGQCNTTGCIDPFFSTTVNHRTGTVEFGRQFNLGRGHRNNVPRGFVYGYGYPYPVYVPIDPSYAQDQPDQGSDAPAATMFENRPDYAPAPNPTPVGPQDAPANYADRNPQPQNDVAVATPGNHNMSPVSDEQIPVLIVFKDGHEQEIKNYAIVGDTLYDLGNYTSHKIKLADLDLKQTIEKNEQRGVDFNLPANKKPIG